MRGALGSSRGLGSPCRAPQGRGPGCGAWGVGRGQAGARCGTLVSCFEWHVTLIDGILSCQSSFHGHFFLI